LITNPTAGFVTPEETSDVTLIASPVPAICAVHRWQARVLTGAGLALLPWLGYLAGTLPPAKAVAWVALDALEAAALLTAGSRLSRADARHRAPAAAAAVLLLTDACLDLATSAPGQELAVAVAMAVAVELPLAVLCTVLATRPQARAATDTARAWPCDQRG
jgi:hypothetical protein